jgi:uracil-DNA glycosylase family 4
MAYSDDLVALSEDVRALLCDYQLRGVAYLDTDDEAGGSAERVETKVPAAPTEWSRVAKRTRAERVPFYGRTPEPGPPGGVVEACRDCRWCEGRGYVTFGSGDREADLVVLGEWPGEQPLQQGEPFGGASGQMLEKMLQHVIGLGRDEVYVINVLPCPTTPKKTPSPDELAACRPFVEEQVSAVKPKIMLIMGALALQHVMGVRGMANNRGREIRYREQIPTITTYHPRHLQQSPADKRLTFEDLKRLRQRYDELGGRRR